MELADRLWQFIVDKLGHATAVFLASIFAALLWIAGRYFLRLLAQFWHFFQSRRRALRAVERTITKATAEEGRGIWLTKPIHQPDEYKNAIKRSKILAIANLKGGVGKTTLATNIGAYFAKDWRKRVLLIDLDFQGSLSSMAFAGKDWIEGRSSSLATRLISGDIRPDFLPDMARPVDLHGQDGDHGILKVVTAYYDLAQADNRIMVEWLLDCRHKVPHGIYNAIIDLLAGKLFRTNDARYTLAEILHSNPVQDAFDIIIIDCPPRLTTSAIQALCASSHLLIPTIFDRTSSEAVVSLCEQIETLKDSGICPHLKYLGVVGSMWNGNQAIQPQTKLLIQAMLREANIAIDLLPTDKFVPHTTKLVKNAEEGIAYLVMPDWQDRNEVRSTIANLAEHIANRMELPQPIYMQEAAE